MSPWPTLQLIRRLVLQFLQPKHVPEPLHLPLLPECGPRRTYVNLLLRWLLYESHLFDLMADVSFRLSVQCTATEYR